MGLRPDSEAFLKVSGPSRNTDIQTLTVSTDRETEPMWSREFIQNNKQNPRAGEEVILSERKEERRREPFTSC